MGASISSDPRLAMLGSAWESSAMRDFISLIKSSFDPVKMIVKEYQTCNHIGEIEVLPFQLFGMAFKACKVSSFIRTLRESGRAEKS